MYRSRVKTKQNCFTRNRSHVQARDQITVSLKFKQDLFTVSFYCFTVKITGGPATKTLRVAAKCKPLADRFVDIFGGWIKQQTGGVRQYAEMFPQVSYFRLVVLPCTFMN